MILLYNDTMIFIFERVLGYRPALDHELLDCIFQDEIEKKCPQLLKLGLLSEVSVSMATVKKQKRYVSFHHKSLQEFSSSKYIVKKLKNSKNILVNIK